MKEQAEILGKNTEYKLRGQVSTHTSEEGEILHAFYVVVPALDGYRYELFEISHGALAACGNSQSRARIARSTQT